MELCKNCKYYNDKICRKQYINPVDGTKYIIQISCIQCREMEIYCGANAKHFKPIERDVYKLWLRAEKNRFLIMCSSIFSIGYITNDGYCYMLCNKGEINLYCQWRKDGMFVDSTPVRWRGGEYQIRPYQVLCRTDIIGNGHIYNFEKCCYMVDCEDSNILRFEHNLKPIGF